MKKPADETMPEVYYEPVNGRKPKPDETVVLCFQRTRTPTAPALDREAVREDTQDKRAEALDDCDELLEMLDNYFNSGAIRGISHAVAVGKIKKIRAILSAKPDADIIGKMEGLKEDDVVFAATEYGDGFNTAIDQCIALVKQGAKVGE